MDPVNEAGEVLRTRAARTRDRIEEVVGTAKGQVEAKVQEYPLRTILISVGVGMVAGLILGLSKRRNSR